MANSRRRIGVVRRGPGAIRPGSFEISRDRIGDFLRFHGYLAEVSEEIRGALVNYQAAHEVPATGNLNHQTCRLLNAIRCVHPERAIAPDEWARRLSGSVFAAPVLAAESDAVAHPEMAIPSVPADHSYELVYGRWSRRSLRYALVGAVPKSLGTGGWEAVQRAFGSWSATGFVMLQETSEPARAEIRVLWTPGPKGDPESTDPFYGPGEKVAVGYPPVSTLPGQLAGDIHFDLSEKWALDPASGLDLETVCLHEVGHALGIGHCKSQSSVMWHAYHPEKHNLTDDDIRELERIYEGLPA